MRLLSQLATGLYLAFSVFTALAADQLTGDPQVTGFSGNNGAELSLSKPVAENDAIFGIEMAERSDDPCYLRVRYRDVTTGEERSSKIFAECDDNNNNRGRESSLVRAILPGDMVVTGASVCLNPQRDKMKGIELRASFRECIRGESTATISVDQCGSVYRRGSQEYQLCSGGHPRYLELSCSGGRSVINRYIERPNCKGTSRGPDNDWEKIIDCPPRTVATGVRISTRGSGGNRIMIDGLALECTQVMTQTRPAEISSGFTGSKLTWSD
mgnify:CR=1 FL=1